MQISQFRQLIFFTLLFFATLTIYIGFMSVDFPKTSAFPVEQENQRIFSIGTLESIPNIEGTILSIDMQFSDISKTGAIVSIDVNIYVQKDEVFESTFIFILPNDVELNYPGNLEVKNKTYAKIVYFPFTINNSTSLGTCSIQIFWPSFSRNVSFGKWSFEIDRRPFHFLFVEDGETFVPLISNSSYLGYWLKMKTNVSINKADYSISDFQPGTDIYSENSVTWQELDAWFSSYVTGMYESSGERLALSSLEKILVFLLGSFASLSLLSLKNIVLSNKESK
jgi:hypothetical protein